jgi:alpha-L-rhamnosidase
VEICGLPAAPALSDVTALVWHTNMTRTGEFTTSDPRLNQLPSNIVWGQRGNFLDVPTDCPQRNERLGWTGDAQVFAPTAAFNYDVSGFFRKWARDVADGQLDSGALPDTAPSAYFRIYPDSPGGNAAWAEAGIICPWVMYQKYGDVRVLEESYPAMTRYLEFLDATADNGIRPDTHYGDWLAPDATRPQWAHTPCDLIGTAYFARAAELVTPVAHVLGRADDVARWAALHERVRAAFRRHYTTADGRVVGDTQTAYLLALAFDLLPEAVRAAAVGYLERALRRRDYYLATGFVGTPLLCPVLARFGRADLAYRLLFNDTTPRGSTP